MFAKSLALAYYAMTPLHVGSGRGLRADLVVQRDALGFPVIYASSAKGPLKSLLYRSGSSLWTHLGSEPYEPSRESKVVFTDAYLLALPVSHERSIIIYATSPYMLRRARDVLELCGHRARREIEDALSKVGDVRDRAVPLTRIEVRRLFVRNRIIEVGEPLGIRIPEELVRGAPYPASKLSDSLIVVPDEIMMDILEESVSAIARVSTSYELKSVRRRGLWTEEQIPMGSVFIGAALFREDVPELEGMLRSGITLALGGRETVGRGLVAINVIS